MSRKEKPGRPHYRVLSNKTILVGALIMTVVAAGSVWLLLEFVSQDPKKNNVLEVVKTAGAILVGIGGGVALLLAARRQRFVELDGTERRITDLQTKAADQLGSDQAAVRLAGLYALERLAQDNPSHRQTIVDVICGYLRMPYIPPPQRPAQRAKTISRSFRSSPTRAQPANAISTTGNERRQEQQVRLTAQRILAAHLRPNLQGRREKPTNPKYWPTIDLDLTGATLIDFRLQLCRIRTGTFANATFIGDTSFYDTTFIETASFNSANFTGQAWFYNTKFSGDTRFYDTNFHQQAWFTNATFGEFTRFTSASFHGDAWFNEARFHGGVRLNMVTFTGNARFNNAKFVKEVSFNTSTFAKHASYRGTSFSGHTSFNLASFKKGAYLGETLAFRHADSAATKSIWPHGWTWGSPASELDTARKNYSGGAWYLLARANETNSGEHPNSPSSDTT